MKTHSTSTCSPIAIAGAIFFLLPLVTLASTPPVQAKNAGPTQPSGKTKGKKAKVVEHQHSKKLVRSHSETSNTAQYVVPGMTPEDMQRDATNLHLSEDNERIADTKLAAGDMVGAEDAYRLAVSLDACNFEAWAGLSKALEQEVKTHEAISTYRYLLYPKPNIVTSLEEDRPLRLHFALLLAGDGQWPEAVQVYERTIRDVNLGHSYAGLSYPSLDIHFTPDDPQPQLFAAMCHIALGIEHNHGSEQDKQAIADYAEALRLEPDLALANFYYGYGLKQIHQWEQAKAAYAAAERLGDAEVRAVAREEIKHL